jgi:hypothetical protein
MNIAHVNYAYADDVADPEALLERYQKRDRLTSRERVIDHFDRELSWTAVARAATAAYEDVIAQRGGGAA